MKRKKATSSDSRNYGSEVEVEVGKCRKDMARELVNKKCLTLGLHNGML